MVSATSNKHKSKILKIPSKDLCKAVTALSPWVSGVIPAGAHKTLSCIWKHSRTCWSEELHPQNSMAQPSLAAEADPEVPNLLKRQSCRTWTCSDFFLQRLKEIRHLAFYNSSLHCQHTLKHSHKTLSSTTLIKKSRYMHSDLLLPCLHKSLSSCWNLQYHNSYQPVRGLSNRENRAKPLKKGFSWLKK